MTPSRSVLPLLRGSALVFALCGLGAGVSAQSTAQQGAYSTSSSSVDDGSQQQGSASGTQGQVSDTVNGAGSSGTVRLQSNTQPRPITYGSNSTLDPRQRRLNGDELLQQDELLQPVDGPVRPDEFETYLRKLGYPGIRRFGQELMSGRGGFDAPETSGLVPAD